MGDRSLRTPLDITPTARATLGTAAAAPYTTSAENIKLAHASMGANAVCPL